MLQYGSFEQASRFLKNENAKLLDKLLVLEHKTAGKFSCSGAWYPFIGTSLAADKPDEKIAIVLTAKGLKLEPYQIWSSEDHGATLHLPKSEIILAATDTDHVLDFLIRKCVEQNFLAPHQVEKRFRSEPALLVASVA